MNRRILLFSSALALPCAACGSSSDSQGTGSSSSTAPSSAIPSTNTNSSTAPAGALQWAACEIDESPGFECATLQVPLNHAAPEGPKVSLALSRRKHKDKDYRGVIVSHPGGPGSAGRGLVFLAEILPEGIGDKYDWVSIDPRGTGQSQPKLDCIGDTSSTVSLPYPPQDPSQQELWKNQAKRIAKECGQGPGKELLAHLHTTDLVQDLEAVRKALGVEKVTYWGSSFGSYVGMMYATLYPEHIEKMALDGVVSPSKRWYASNLEQQKALAGSLEKYYEWLASKHDQYQLGKDTAAVKKKIEDKLSALRDAAPPKNGQPNPAQMLTRALQSAAYSVALWSPMAMALKMSLVDGNDTILRALGEDTPSDVHSVYLAVTCSEDQWPAWEQTLADATASHQASSPFSWRNTWFNAPCVEWTVPVKKQPEINPAGVNFPILLFSETSDGATPFSGALEARRLFPSSALVEGVGGTSHSATLSAGPCVQKAVLDFFSSGTLPARVSGDESDKKCEPVQPSAALHVDPSATQHLRSTPK